jgi:hypothetical protein
MTLTFTPCCEVHKLNLFTPSGRPLCSVCGYEEEPPPIKATCPKCAGPVFDDDLGRGCMAHICQNPKCDWEGYST